MTDMIEKVAYEIRRACAASYAVEEMLCPWDDVPENDKQGWRKIARAAISALMEPTDRMLCDGHAAGARKNMIWEAIPEGDLPLRLLQEYLPAAYQAMLKAALDD